MSREVYLQWSIEEISSELGMQTQSIEVINGVETATLKLQPYQIYEKMPQTTPVAQPINKTPEVYDQLIVFLKEGKKRNTYTNCFDLKQIDLEDALIIPVT